MNTAHATYPLPLGAYGLTDVRAGEGSTGAGRLPRGVLALAAASIPLGIYGEWAFSRTGVDVPMFLYDLAVGWAFVAAGLVVSLRQPDNRSGLLMVAEGFTWFLTNLEGSPVAALVFLGGLLVVLNEAVLAHLILALPSGRATSNLERGLIVSAYVLAGVGGLVHTLARSGFDPYRCRDCTAGIVWSGHESLLAGVERGCEALATLLAAVLCLVIVRRWLRSAVIRRRAMTPLWLALGSCALLLGSHAATSLQYQPSVGLGRAWIWASGLLQLAVPAGFLVVALRMRVVRLTVGEVMLGLGPNLSVGGLQAALGRALGDPSIQVGLWDDESSSYRDAKGHVLPLPERHEWRMASTIDIDDNPCAGVSGSHSGKVARCQAILQTEH